MPLPKFYKVVQDQNGNIVPQVLGSVFNQGTAVLASLYQDDAGTVPLSNPMTSDAQYGSFKFYLNPGHYDLTFTKPGYTFEPIYDLQVVADVLTLGTMATQDANAVAITGGTAALARAAVGQGLDASYALAVTGTSLISGNLGIGTAPGYALDVNGNTYVRQRLGLGVVPDALLALNVSGPSQFSGNVGIGASPTVALDVNGSTYARGNTGIGVAPDGGTIRLKVDGLNQLGSFVGINTPPATYTLNVNGNIGLPGGTGGIANSTSRAALKQAIRPITEALSTLQRVRPRQWEWRAAYPDLEALMPGTQLGFVTEEITADLPSTTAVTADGTLAHSERGLVALLVAAMQELTARVAGCEARLAAGGTA